jgi:hypothetical protein
MDTNDPLETTVVFPPPDDGPTPTLGYRRRRPRRDLYYPAPVGPATALEPTEWGSTGTTRIDVIEETILELEEAEAARHAAHERAVRERRLDF